MKIKFDEFLNEEKKMKFKTKKLEALLKDVFYKGWKSAEVLWTDKKKKDTDYVQNLYKKAEEEAVSAVMKKEPKLEVANENTQTEFNTESGDALICPYCGHEQEDHPENIMSGGGGMAPEFAECECEKCGETFEASKTIIILYNTEKI